MPRDIPVDGIDYSLTKYVASRDIISLPDLISFFKSDACLKVAHIILNLKCSLYFYSGVNGSGDDNNEFVQLLKIREHNKNSHSYINHANRFFLIKQEVCNIIKSEPWFTFNRKGITPETKKFPPEYTTSFSVKQTAFLLFKYDKHPRIDIKYEFNRWCHGCTFLFISDINEECNSIGDINKNNINVSFLTEYNPDMVGHIHSFEEAKQYARDNNPSNKMDEINLTHYIKNKYMLSNPQIASIVFESEINDIDIDTLTKRIQRNLKKHPSQRSYIK